jgi:ElaB/YqjD/DUF883 family membrane-anchored ribosome-binding protein
MQAKLNAAEPGNGQSVEAKPTVLATASSVGSALSREVQYFLADIEDLVKATTSLTGEELARAKVKLAERIAAAKASVGQMGGAIADGTRHAAQATDSYVHERPWQAIGIGAGLGVLVGFLLARRA